MFNQEIFWKFNKKLYKIGKSMKKTTIIYINETQFNQKQNLEINKVRIKIN